MRKVAGKHPFCVLIYMNTYIFHICFILFILLSISNIWCCMLDVIIGRHTCNCQIRTHIHTGYTHTGTHTKMKTGKGGKKKEKEEGGWVFRGVEERGYWGGQDLILITLDRHESFSVFHHLQKDKQRKQHHSLKLGKKRRESSTCNYYIILPKVIIKAIIIIGSWLIRVRLFHPCAASRGDEGRNYGGWGAIQVRSFRLIPQILGGGYFALYDSLWAK